MNSLIQPWTEKDTPMQPWPDLAPFARVLSLGKDSLFFYDTGGEGTAGAARAGKPEKPAIILIHGLGDEADSWRRLIPILGKGRRVLAPDLPGFGRSRASGRINRRRHTAAILRLLETAADEAHPAVLAGSSMGAIIAEEAAGKRPALVKDLVLLDGCFPSPAPRGGFPLLALPLLGKKWYRAFRTNPEGAYQSLFGYYHDLNKMDAADRDFLRKRVMARVESPTQERAYFATLRSLLFTYAAGGRNISRAIAAFPGRILLLWGEEDKVFQPAAAGAFRALKPGAEFRLIPGAGHLPHQECPEETAAAMESFLG